MDINRFRYFCVLAKAPSMREAAELLHISQPALSKAVKKLEEEVGYPLTIPSGRGITITDQGRRLAIQIEPILDSIKYVVAHPNGADQHFSKPLRIGTFEVFSTYFFGAFAAEHLPHGTKLDLHELVPGRLEEQVASGSIDIGITYIPIPHADLTFEKAAQFSMGIYGKKDVFADIPFAELPFVVPIMPLTGTPSKVQGLDGWPDEQLPRHILYRVALMESALELCRRGLAVAYLPEAIVQLQNSGLTKDRQLTRYPLPRGMKPQVQPVYLVQRKTNLDDRAIIKKLAKALRMVSSKSE